MYRYGTGEAVVLKLSANSYRYGTGEPVVQTAQRYTGDASRKTGQGG